MPRASLPPPRDLQGWPDPVQLALRHTDLTQAGVLLARWLQAVSTAMRERELSQAALAEGSGVGLRTVSRILGGGAWPEFPTLVALSSAAGVQLPAGGATEALNPRDYWPVCTACDALLLEESYATRARAENAEVSAAFEVVMTNHGRVWTGVRCEWMDRLRRLGYGWRWTPQPFADWEGE